MCQALHQVWSYRDFPVLVKFRRQDAQKDAVLQSHTGYCGASKEAPGPAWARGGQPVQARVPGQL